jgi:hypothetical protein
MRRSIILAVVIAIASLAVTPMAEAKKGGGGKWKGPPPHGNAWGYYNKFGGPGYWYGGYPYGYARGYAPPAYYGSPAPMYGNPSVYYAPAVPPALEPLPPPPPASY